MPLRQGRRSGGPRLVSVVIPTYQRRALLERALRALARQNMAADHYEIVVSIDGSVDDTETMLAAFESPYPLVWCWHPNLGRAIACNLGVAISRGDLIVLLDDDMEATPGFLEAHAAEHRRGPGRAVVGAAPVVTTVASTAAARYMAARFARHLEQIAAPGYRFTLRDFYSGNFSISRSLLLQTGGFDEAFTIYGNEDLELSWRLAAAGVEIAFSPDAVAYQHYTKDFPALARDNIANGRTAVLLAAKHPSTVGHLKLGSHAGSSLPRRLVVGVLLVLTRMWPRTSDVVIRMVDAFGHPWAPAASRIYSVVLDYLYFVGATAAKSESGAGDRAVAPTQ